MTLSPTHFVYRKALCIPRDTNNAIIFTLGDSHINKAFAYNLNASAGVLDLAFIQWEPPSTP